MGLSFNSLSGLSDTSIKGLRIFSLVLETLQSFGSIMDYDNAVKEMIHCIREWVSDTSVLSPDNGDSTISPDLQEKTTRHMHFKLV